MSKFTDLLDEISPEKKKPSNEEDKNPPNVRGRGINGTDNPYSLILFNDIDDNKTLFEYMEQLQQTGELTPEDIDKILEDMVDFVDTNFPIDEELTDSEDDRDSNGFHTVYPPKPKVTPPKDYSEDEDDSTGLNNDIDFLDEDNKEEDDPDEEE